MMCQRPDCAYVHPAMAHYLLNDKRKKPFTGFKPKFPKPEGEPADK